MVTVLVYYSKGREKVLTFQTLALHQKKTYRKLKKKRKVDEKERKQIGWMIGRVGV